MEASGGQERAGDNFIYRYEYSIWLFMSCTYHKEAGGLWFRQSFIGFNAIFLRQEIKQGEN